MTAQPMSLPGRPKGEYRSAQHEGTLKSHARRGMRAGCPARGKCEGDLARASGFTLIELMVGLSVASILLMVAVPSFSNMFTRLRVEGVANELAADLQYARTESIRLRANVSLTPDNDGLGYQLLNAATPLKAVRFSTGLSISTGTTVTFSQLRGMASAVNLDLAATGATLRVATNSMGRVLMCSPDQSVKGYASC